MKIGIEKFKDILERNGVTKEGYEIADEIDSTEPERRPRASKHGKNKTVRYPSDKNGFVVHVESKTLEFAGALLYELDGAVKVYWSQPYSLYVRYKSGKRTVTINTVIDFFIISDDFVGFVEWKNANKLFSEAKKSSDRFYFHEEEQEFYSPAIERALEGTGLQYKICYEKHAPKVLIDNLEFLHKYYTSEPGKKVLAGIEQVVSLVSEQQSYLIKDLIEVLGFSDPIYYAIARRRVFYPLKEIRLIDTVNSLVFIDESECRNYRRKVDLLDLERQDSIISQSILRASEIDLLHAAKRLEVIERLINKDITRSQAAEQACISLRTVDRSKRAIKGIENHSLKLSALINKNYKKGNHESKIDKKVLRLMNRLLDQLYFTKVAPNANYIYGKLKIQCRKKQLAIPSTKTFYQQINNVDRYESDIRRRGEKAAYQQTAFEFLNIDSEYRLGATRYLQYCHIDHTEIDTETFTNLGTEISARAWLVIIVDEFTGMVLASYLSYRSPSYVSVMIAIRLCVLKHKVVPENLVVDGGKEFQGTSLELLAAACLITIISRQGQPRGGIAIERMFGVLNTMFFHNLEGNTKYMKDVRSVAATHNPKKNAKWTLLDLARMLERFIDVWNIGGAIKQGLSPEELRSVSHQYFGERAFLKRDYDLDFEMLTLPYIKRKQVTIFRGKAIKHEKCEYWHDDFKNLKDKKIKADAKEDPLDIQKVYVYLYGKWLPCKISNALFSPIDSDKAIRSEQTRMELSINLKAKGLAQERLIEAVDEKKEEINRERKLIVKNQEVRAEDEPGDCYEVDPWSLSVPRSELKGDFK